MNFYRLEQVDFDGQKAYSDVQSIDMYRSKIAVYPTSTSDYVTVDGIDQATEYRVFSNQQKLILDGEITRGDRIDLCNLSPGLYYVMINSETFKIMKI